MIAVTRITAKSSTRNLRQKLQLNNYFSSKVPDEPTWVPIDKEKLPKVPELDEATVNHLERLSLVKFNNQAGVERLYKAIEYANQLHMVDTEGVEPLDSVLENRSVYLREDKVTDGNCLKDILQNASLVVEDYFVAPPGNIPLKPVDKKSSK
ncbi:hypothetical protein CHS0354_002226 [Potamilus streckersoni]|uniref:Glutamyl-tRNA(Gln) amidotransferase subunit C, mitochondrial n=1 Tax=Potamilus streckersoni TaxID=2493646 RepID=A0AAE0TCH9_9BIVA|nr:hypothetical protein CHS0354_002226 [Potamilus streckersoni]